jgi:S-adenosylmethionine/arginine decarboxylase-like enzyme
MRDAGRGQHWTADFARCEHKDLAQKLSALTDGVKGVCERNGLRVVGEKAVLFDGFLSPPGYTAVVLLDESHISVHCYADEGLIAFDCFTCAKDPVRHVRATSDLKALVLHLFPQSRLCAEHRLVRFVE